ncbi:putative nucleic-acid-binding protein containing a Zn-ribbon domain [Halobacteroides halobius DSM 5150]|uniref:Putative nucleic-acid-binding protein containing a Zn-ribbon domain n=1 Tax=Halobacteroides halobius (strain ATCC 35273 / DSM 5150 / MD-1) TaxID=748449 RepID=L0KAF3_HALHC|nr:zinc ribbon domain-containing protein [Halobacteroides halobius]AGB41329.1 putative nucleic-acid-binding protein containing a Zn-ribbon domain [Halobacteroides halobius DSM 5150]
MSKDYTCPKCGNKNYESDTFSATGGGLSKVFDVQNKKFTTITCSKCGYTELYKNDTSTLSNIFDFFTD